MHPIWYNGCERKTRAMNYKRESNKQIGASVQRRTVVVDIETVSLDPSEEQGALNAMNGRVVCIGMLVDDGVVVTETTFAGEDERSIISNSWSVLKPNDLIVGHNVLDFDLAFLQQRSWILGIKPSCAFDTRRYYTKHVIDTLQLWTNWTGNKKGVTLDALGSVLGCGRKTGEGLNVAQWWAEGNIDRIKKYCRDDVRLAYRVFCRLTYQEAKPVVTLEEQVLKASATKAGTADAVAEIRLT